MAEGRVAVAGGGLAGLSAACRLKDWGYAVELFERSRLLGGKATSFEVDGVEVDNGQHVFLGCCTDFIDFVSALGLMAGEPPALVLQPRFEALLLPRTGGRVHLRAGDWPAPLHLLPVLEASSHLGITGRLDLVRALLSANHAHPGESFASWLRRRRQGAKAGSGFWEPFVVPALNASFEEVSADEALFVIRTAFLENPGNACLGFSRVPLAHIAQRAAAGLDAVHLRTALTALEREAGRVRLNFGATSAKTFDGAVLALPPQRLKAALGAPKTFGVFGLDQFEYAPIVDVHLWFDIPPHTILRSEPVGFAALLGSPIQWVFEKPAPPGETYLCCSMSAAREHVGWKAEALVNLCLGELRMVMPELEGIRPIRSAATRDREATFVPSMGLVRPGPQTRNPRVVIAGAWTDTGWPATMESAVRSGRAAAQALHDAMSQAS